MSLDVLADEPYDVLERLLSALKSINPEEQTELMKMEATKKQRQDMERRKREKQKDRQELVGTLDRFLDDHPIMLLIKRMNITAADGNEIKNAQMIRGLPTNVLKGLTDKAEQLIRLAEEYGVDIEWYSQEEMDYLLDELFSEER